MSIKTEEVKDFLHHADVQEFRPTDASLHLLLKLALEYTTKTADIPTYTYITLKMV